MFIVVFSCREISGFATDKLLNFKGDVFKLLLIIAAVTGVVQADLMLNMDV